MIIRDKDNFLPLIAKILTALNYDKVEMHTGKPYDITAVKDDKKYCFKWQYDIDAVGTAAMKEFVDGTKDMSHDARAFITNSSFISGAKKLGDEAGVLLWDRNTLDRMSIGIKENIVEDVQEETKSGKGLLTGIIIAVVAIAAIAAYFLIIK